MGSSDSKSFSPEQPRQARAPGGNGGPPELGVSPHSLGSHTATQHGHRCHWHTCTAASLRHTFAFMRHSSLLLRTTHVPCAHAASAQAPPVLQPQEGTWGPPVGSPAHWPPAGPFLMQMTPGSIQRGWGPSPFLKDGVGAGQSGPADSLHTAPAHAPLKEREPVTGVGGEQEEQGSPLPVSSLGCSSPLPQPQQTIGVSQQDVAAGPRPASGKEMASGPGPRSQPQVRPGDAPFD